VRPQSLAARFAVANRVAINALLFLSSFAPLFVILAIRFQQPYLKVVCGALALIGSTCLWAVMHAAVSRKSPETVTPTAIDDKGTDVSGYLAAYLLPFVALPDPTITDQIAYLLFLVVAGSIYVQSRMLQINPTLYLFSWHVFAVTSSREHFQGYLIARGNILIDEPLTVVRLRDGLLIALR
jgi:hypothetical protein